MRSTTAALSERGYSESNLLRRLAHRRPHRRAQIVDQHALSRALDMPERPAVASGQPLRERADLVDRADRRAQRQGAVDADQGPIASPGVDASLGGEPQS